MMKPYLAAKTDSHQAAIVDALRRVGFLVACTHRVGDGFVDLVAAGLGRVFLIEVKRPGAKLTPAEQRFHELWGDYVHIVTTPEEAIELVTAPPTRQGEWW